MEDFLRKKGGQGRKGHGAFGDADVRSSAASTLGARCSRDNGMRSSMETRSSASLPEDSAAAPLAHTIYLRAAALMMPSEEHLQRTTLAATPTQTCCKRKRDWASLAVCPPPLKAAPQPVARALACRTLAVYDDDGMDQSREGAVACALTLRAPPLDSSGAAEASQHGLIRPVALKR